MIASIETYVPFSISFHRIEEYVFFNIADRTVNFYSVGIFAHSSSNSLCAVSEIYFSKSGNGAQERPKGILIITYQQSNKPD